MLSIHLVAVQGSVLRILLTLLFLPPVHHGVIGKDSVSQLLKICPPLNIDDT